MAKYRAGDYVKVEFKGEGTGESEWMWVRVDICDDKSRLVYGRLDSIPLVHTGKLKLHSEVAVTYANVREHRRPGKFKRSLGE